MPSYWFKIIEASIMCVTALLIGLFVARPLIARMFTPNPPGGPLQIANASPGRRRLARRRRARHRRPWRAAAIWRRRSQIDISRIEGQVRRSSAKKVGEVVNAHPEEALAIIRTWLHQPV